MILAAALILAHTSWREPVRTYPKPVRSALLLKGCRLEIQTLGIVGEPMEAFEHLFLVRPGQSPKEIKTLANLSDAVSIRTGADAVAFVRLRTSGKLYHLFQAPLAFEAMSVSRLATMKDEDPRQVKFLSKDARGYRGIVASKGPATFLDQFPKVSVVKGAYRVERILLLLSSTRKQYVARVVEEVAPNGGYRVLETDRSPLKPLRGVRWVFPMLE